MGEQVRAGNVDFWVERRGQGPEVLIISVDEVWSALRFRPFTEVGSR